jgi:predicted MFS family arabinose efflux permease
VVIKFSISNVVNGVGVGLFGPFVTYFLYRRYGAGPQLIGLLFSMINIVALVSNLSAAGVARRVGLVKAMTLSWLFQSVLLIPMALAPNFWISGGIYFVRMFIQRLNTPLRRSYLVAISPPGERGSVAALTGLPTQGAIGLAPTLAGYLFERATLAAPFEVGALLQAAGTGLFWVFFRNVHPPEELAKGDALLAEASAATTSGEVRLS